MQTDIQTCRHTDSWTVSRQTETDLNNLILSQTQITRHKVVPSQSFTSVWTQISGAAIHNCIHCSSCHKLISYITTETSYRVNACLLMRFISREISSFIYATELWAGGCEDERMLWLGFFWKVGAVNRWPTAYSDPSYMWAIVYAIYRRGVHILDSVYHRTRGYLNQWITEALSQANRSQACKVCGL